MLTKADLRRKLLQNREAQPDKDRRILANLLACKGFAEARIILTYVSTEREIDTRGLISHCLEVGKKVAVPRTGVHTIAFYEITSLDELEQGRFGIAEPKGHCKSVQISRENARAFCVVPALACSADGFRLGYGKGYYDRFLRTFSGTTAALCYSEKVMELPVEPHDVAVNLVITELL